MATILDYTDTPKYNIKAVSQKTEIQAVTIRAWERRYQLLAPSRAENGYRMYSDRDVAILTWVKKKVEEGLSISSVVAEFNQAIGENNWPEAVMDSKGPLPFGRQVNKEPGILVQQMVTALVRTDERMAGEIFSEAMGSFRMAQFFEEVLAPTLVEIGTRWERGEISVAIEHFASSLIQGKLQGIYHSLPLHSSAPKVLVGCAPDELHQIGPLMFATLLRNAGYRVEFLGSDVPFDDLLVYVSEEKPRMVVISATMVDSAQQMASFGLKLEMLNPKPLFGFSGSAFLFRTDLIEKIKGNYLGRSLAESLQNVSSLLPLRSKSKFA